VKEGERFRNASLIRKKRRVGLLNFRSELEFVIYLRLSISLSM
jgi:hypothetical protein